MTQKFDNDKINVSSVKVYFDPNTSTTTTESKHLVQYETQHFRCKVDLDIEESFVHRNWVIGLVQACDTMYLENRYGEIGSSFWEFHPIKSRRHHMVNDSDGQQYPFYCAGRSKYEVQKGHSSSRQVRLQFDDHFYPTVAWELPFCPGARLSDVQRRQAFWVWLVAVRRAAIRDATANSFQFQAGRDELHVLSAMRWTYRLHLRCDPLMPVGQRVRAMDDRQTESPRLLSASPENLTSDLPPVSAVSPPHCNAAQSLVWYPRQPQKRPRLLVPPKQVVVPWDVWLRDMGLPSKAPRPRDLRVWTQWCGDPILPNPLGRRRRGHSSNGTRELSATFSSSSSFEINPQAATSQPDAAGESVPESAASLQTAGSGGCCCCCNHVSTKETKMLQCQRDLGRNISIPMIQGKPSLALGGATMDEGHGDSYRVSVRRKRS